ncbi:hypothetical protein PUN28_010601 [Cardiocondyla obscurior]|uniref:Uncharacterized protein n=1 Tax=Cardiocondyla obscurior TaxID=286306 RepID=A0AAW2FMH6_9HYME
MACKYLDVQRLCPSQMDRWQHSCSKRLRTKEELKLSELFWSDHLFAVLIPRPCVASLIRIIATWMRFPSHQFSGVIDDDRIYGAADNFLKCR